MQVLAVFSSAVPVLPATVTPGIAAAVPVPSRTTPIIRRRTVWATDGCSSQRCRRRRAGAAAEVKVGWGRRPPSAIVAATVAISSALACTSPWPIAVEPTSSWPWICAAGGSVLSTAPGDPGAVVEAVAFGRRHQARRAELGAERGEHGVARDRERQFERAAAFLAVGVVQLDAVERRVGRVGEDGAAGWRGRLGARP